MSKNYTYYPCVYAASLLCLTLMLCLFVPKAIAAGEEAIQGDVEKPGATIWLEEKITPSSHWMEELVQPMTRWMEERLHGQSPQQRRNDKAAVPQAGTEPEPLDATFIDKAQAIAVARESHEGEVLHCKLLPASQRFRVKLLTNQGEIHIVYVDAVRAVILPPQTAEE